MSDAVIKIRAVLASLRLSTVIEKMSRWPSGTPGGKGGQFAPANGAGGQGSLFGGGLWGASKPHGDWDKPIIPASARPHPKAGEKGEQVLVHYPTKHGAPEAWGKPDEVATVAPGGVMPHALHGVPFKSWKPPADWTKVSGTNPKIDADEPFTHEPHQRPGAGVVIIENDGRMWITKPTNNFGGYVHSWPKGGIEEGMTLQQTAIKEAWEETGLKVKITGLLGDYEGDTSKARYYIARREGGTPADMGWETQAMRLAPPNKLKGLLNKQRDKDIADHISEILRFEGIVKEKGGGKSGKTGAWANQPRWEAGSPLGGQWKEYDAAGFALPPKIAGGLEGKNTAYQKQVNALYSAVKAGDQKTVNDAVANLSAKVAANEAKGAKSSHVKWTAQVHQYGASLLTTQGQSAQATAAADAVKGPEKISGWKQVGAKPGGSAPGAVYTDEKGVKWLVKGNLQAGDKSSDDRAKNEVLAAHLLNAVGSGAPEMKLVDLGKEHGGGLGVATRWMDDIGKFNPGNKAHIAAAQQHFAVQAWLGNYDAIGQAFDNTMMTKDGKAVCIDPGGAILFRAQGKPKDAGAFGPVVNEIKTLRDPTKNAQAAAVYGSMTASQIAESAGMLKNISDETITKLVNAYGPGDAKMKADLAKVLIARRGNAIAQAAALAPEPKEAPVAAPANKPAFPTRAPTAKPAEPAGGITPPVFKTGYAKTDAAYNAAIVAVQQKHSEAAAGDGSALAKLSIVVSGFSSANLLYQGEGSAPVKVQAKSASGKKMAAYLAAMYSDAKAKHDAAKAEKDAADTKAATEAKAASDKATKAADVAPPKFDDFKLPASNTNAAAHNGKLDTLKGLAAKGDVKGILALNYGTNTYGKKQAQIANDALAALGSSSKVTPGQKTNSHPDLSGKNQPAPPPTKAEAAKVETKPDPATIAGMLKLPKPDFINWNGSGKGLSSMAAKNEANQTAVNRIEAVAQKADMAGLKAMTFEEIDPATGQKTGKVKPFSDHPSKHVQAFYADAIQALDTALNPPRAIKLVDVGAFKSASEISQHFTAKPLGTTVQAVKASQKFGFWIALGGVTDTKVFRPEKTFDMGKETIKQGYEQYTKFSSNTKKFIERMQASGSFADAYRNGMTEYGGHNLKTLYEAAKKDAIQYAEGTTLYRWQNMPEAMIKQIMDSPDGIVYQATGPMPHSYDPTATSGFGKHRVKVHMAEGAKAIPSFGSHGFPSEKEVTTLPLSRFMVLSKKWVPDTEHGKPGQKRLEIEVLMLPHAD